MTHFLVDFSCAFLLFSESYENNSWYLCLLLYNFCAFALQMPLGLLADRLNRNAWVAAMGCIFVAAAFLSGNHYITAAVLAGIGNGLFHVGGGIDVLNISKEKSGALGIFVSPGAFGIFFGTMLGKQQALSTILMVIILSAAAVLIPAVICGFRFKKTSGNTPISFNGVTSPKLMLALVCLFLVVCMRSYVGMIMNFPWKTENAWGVILICGVVLGKAAGGLLADRIGSIKASVVSLGVSALCFMFSDVPYLGIAAVFFFNMTMPITLWATARILPGAKGFSFGLLTFGLFLGFAPVYLGLEPLFTASYGFVLASIVSLILLFIGLKKAVRA